jgi:starvation-inducible DNA-binding protein
MKPNIEIPDNDRAAIVDILNQLLSDEYVLYTKTRNYHWNVVGLQFDDPQRFFEVQYEALDEIVDDVAERARSLGGRAFGTLAEFAKHARLTERPEERLDARGMLADLLGDHETLVRQLRGDLEAAVEKYRDAGTSDFLTGLMEKHEKMAWMLRAFVEG